MELRRRRVDVQSVIGLSHALDTVSFTVSTDFRFLCETLFRKALQAWETTLNYM